MPSRQCTLKFVLIITLLSSLLYRHAPSTVASSTPVPIPVLLFHRIVEQANNEWTDTSIEKFKSILAYLNEHGFTTLSSEQFDAIQKYEIEAPENPILLTFDDATSDFLHTVLPLLEQYDMQSVLFLVPGVISEHSSVYLSHEQLQTIATNNSSVSIENHSYKHEQNVWKTISEEDALARLTQANEYIEALTGKPVLMLAYPYGEFNVETKKAAATLDIPYGFIAWNHLKRDYYELPRYYIKMDTTLEQIAIWIGGPPPEVAPSLVEEPEVIETVETTETIEVTEQTSKLDPALYSSRLFYPQNNEQNEIEATAIDQPTQVKSSSQSDIKFWLVLISIAVLFVLIIGKQKIYKRKRKYTKRE